MSKLVNINGQPLQSSIPSGKHATEAKEVKPTADTDEKLLEEMGHVVTGLYQIGGYNHHIKILNMVKKVLTQTWTHKRDQVLIKKLESMINPPEYYQALHEDVTERVRTITAKKPEKKAKKATAKKKTARKKKEVSS